LLTCAEVKKQTPRSPTSSGRKPPDQITRTTRTANKPEARTSASSARIPVRGSRGASKAAAKSATKVAAKPAGKTTGRAAAKSPGRSGVKNRSAAAPAEPTVKDARALDESRDLALAAIEAALDKKALMPVLIDVSAMASYTDFIGIVSGRSDRQVGAIADNVSQFMKGRGRHILGHEGSGNGRWTLLDYGDIVIHVFYHPVREFYDLESLWIEAPRVKMVIPPEAMLTQPDALYGTL
jgi:ribosome-associated protein